MCIRDSIRVGSARKNLLPNLRLFETQPATVWTGPGRILAIAISDNDRKPTRLIAQALTDPSVAAPAAAWRGAMDWLSQMGPRDTRLLVNWAVPPPPVGATP
eukprot:13716911-Alexandrium_andersonii.AAC.1